MLLVQYLNYQAEILLRFLNARSNFLCCQDKPDVFRGGRGELVSADMCVLCISTAPLTYICSSYKPATKACYITDFSSSFIFLLFFFY